MCKDLHLFSAPLIALRHSIIRKDLHFFECPLIVLRHSIICKDLHFLSALSLY